MENPNVYSPLTGNDPVPSLRDHELTVPILQHESVTRTPTKLLTELVGTAFLVFVVCTSATPLAPVAICFILVGMIYAGGHISGAHYNPAVTLGLLVRGKVSVVDSVGYVVAQVVGSLLGGAAGRYMEPNSSFMAPTIGSGVDYSQAITCEIILTFALVWTVLNVATTKAQRDNQYFGLAIAFVVLSGAVSVGPISGGVFNPAVGLLVVFKDFNASHLLVFVFGPLIGGLLAGLLFRFALPEELAQDGACRICELIGNDAVVKVVRNALGEFIGTFYLSFTVATSLATSNGSFLAPLAIGGMLASQIFANSALCGGHFNPAVTTSVFVRQFRNGDSEDIAEQERMRLYMGATNIVVQVLTSLVAGVVARAVIPDGAVIGFPTPKTGYNAGKVVLGELIGTFALTYVVLHSATAKGNSGNSYFGIAIGATLCSMIVAIGNLTGAAFNPGVGLLSVVAPRKRAVWYYWVGPMLGGLLSALTFRLQDLRWNGSAYKGGSL